MAGVDNIVKEILQEAETAAGALLNEAKENADKIIRDGAKADEKASEAAKAKAEKAVADLASRAVSQCALRKRQALLKAKQEIIDEVVHKAYMKLSTQDTDAYFSMVKTLVQKNVRAGEGKVCFSETDLKAVPAGFAEDLDKIAKEAGGTLTVSPDPVKIRSGFILSYGGIEENCSLDAIFAGKADTLRDLANSILW
jgi:V/A-type H+-transporting ATPase subunit E